MCNSAGSGQDGKPRIEWQFDVSDVNDESLCDFDIEELLAELLVAGYLARQRGERG